MNRNDFRSAYSRFLSANEGWLHFAAHSHHLWPDCTREAQLRYWDDSALGVDRKWEYVFGNVIRRSKESIAEILKLRDTSTICVAPNTHEFVARILSCFEPGKPLRILTSDSEFYSFSRQVNRFEEYPWVTVNRVPVEPFINFEERLEKSLGWRPA